MTPAERFMAKVEKRGECWVWTAGTRAGYGAFHPTSKHVVRAHRWAYEHFVGPIPVGLDLDHLCRVRLCVNPDHLEPVTKAENIRRGVSPSADNTRKTHCKRGHEFTSENTAMVSGRRPGVRWRRCKLCAASAWPSQRRKDAPA